MFIDSETGVVLDLSSTSQTSFAFCTYHAPLVAIMYGGRGRLVQACCNHWDCPRCGQVRAKQEYRRIVGGCEKLADAGYTLYFYTLTCRGKELKLEDAEANYYEWTNRLLTSFRAHIKRRTPPQHWVYTQITERQKRGHPHSHLIAAFKPEDSIQTTDEKGKPAYVSEWFTEANSRAGLGSQHRITLIQSASAASRYVAKYMFKQTMFDVFPPKWKRVRYSEEFPALEALATPEFVQVLRTPRDWHTARKTGIRFECESVDIFNMAAHRIDNIAPPSRIEVNP